jgi:alanine racemase
MANSAAILKIPDSYYDMVRPGIMIYGLYPYREIDRTIKLKPAMALKTRVVEVKKVRPGTPIGYGRTFVTQKETSVATLPIGYADGYSRHLSNRGEVLIQNRRAPIIGTICMDMCTIDVSDIHSVQPGNEVILFGDGLSVEEVAEKAGTISYEIVSTMGKRLPRVYVD